MKKFTIYLIIGFLPLLVMGQVDKQSGNESLLIPDSLKSIIPISKQSLLKDVDVIFNTRMAYESYFMDGDHTNSHFNMNQLRFEVKGKIHEKVYFRFRNRHTREPIPGNLDNISRSVDLAFLRVDVAPRTNITFGKLYADWGGYEFDYNPIDILAYNDIIEYADNFLMGAGIAHTLEGNKHTFSFQVLNSRTKTYEEQYGASAPPDLEASEYALAAVINWRGSFFDGKFETTYSYSYFNEAKGAGMGYFVLGNKFKTKKFALHYDFQYDDEGLDRLGIVTGIIDSQYQYAAKDALYIENWVRAEYLLSSKFNLLLSVMNSNHYWKDNPDPNANDRLSTSYGLIPEIQYMPFSDINLKFYLGYVARKYDYTSYATSAFGANDYTTGQLSFGIVAPLLVL